MPDDGSQKPKLPGKEKTMTGYTRTGWNRYLVAERAISGMVGSGLLTEFFNGVKALARRFYGKV